MKGMSLIEVIVSLIIFSFLGMATASIVGFSQKVKKKVIVTNEQDNQKRFFFNSILRDARFIYLDRTAQSTEIIFEGKDDELTFTTLSGIPYWGKSRKQKVRYFLEEGDKNYNLIRSIAVPYKNSEEVKKFILFKNVKKLKIIYYDNNLEKYEDKWDIEDVSSGGKKPYSIKVNLTLFDERTQKDKLYEFEVKLGL